MFSPQCVMPSPIKDPMLTDLPLIMASGTFRTLSSMPEAQIEKFLGYLVRFTCNKFNASPLVQPSWWTESVIYMAEFSTGQVPLPYTRNKSVKMRRLIRLCYVAHGCKDLLSLSEKLAALHALSYKFISNTDGTVTVMQVSTRTPIVMIPASNLDYDLELPTGLSRLRDISVIPVRTTLLVFDSKRVVKTTDDEANNCILIEDSSSDDDVQIVSYEKGAFPPTPPKRKLPMGIRPGPACSKVRLKQDTSVPVSYGVCSLSRTPQPVRPPILQHPPGWIPSSPPGTVPRPALQEMAMVPKVPTAKKYLRFRNARPKQHQQQTYTFLDIDLTIDNDEDDDPEKTACLPKQLTQKSFLAGFSLFGTGCKPPEIKCSPVVREKTNRMLNLKNLSIDQVPFMVGLGLLPKRCLCSQKELERKACFIDRYTRRDFECSRIVVNVNDKAAVARVARRCFVRVKRLSSADLRKWRKWRRGDKES